jgi:hypothetical protein
VSQNRVRISHQELDLAVLDSVLELDKFEAAFWKADLTVDNTSCTPLEFYRCHLGIHVGVDVAMTQIKGAVTEWCMEP